MHQVLGAVMTQEFAIQPKTGLPWQIPEAHQHPACGAETRMIMLQVLTAATVLRTLLLLRPPHHLPRRSNRWAKTVAVSSGPMFRRQCTTIQAASVSNTQSGLDISQGSMRLHRGWHAKLLSQHLHQQRTYQCSLRVSFCPPHFLHQHRT